MEKKIRIFLSETLEENKEIVLDKNQSHYIVNVMRLRINAELLVFNGRDGEFLGKIINQAKKIIKIYLIKKVRKQTQLKDITLAFCPLKGTRLDFLIQKCTEIGVKNFLPILSDHTINRTFNDDRLKKIIVESCEQSDQISLPSLKKIIKFEDFVSPQANRELVLFADINAKNNSIDHHLSNKNKNITLFIGPEGDFSPKERELIKMNNNFKSFSLGGNILRSETAAISGLVLLNFLLN